MAIPLNDTQAASTLSILVRPGPSTQHKYAGLGCNSCQKSNSRTCEQRTLVLAEQKFWALRHSLCSIDTYLQLLHTPHSQSSSSSPPQMWLLHSLVHSSLFFLYIYSIAPPHLSLPPDHQPSSAYLTEATSIWMVCNVTRVDLWS